MTIRAFRNLPWDVRQKMIQQVDDFLTRRILEIAFLGDGRISWAQVACRIGGGNSPESIRKRTVRMIKCFDQNVQA
ncbi:hypothetical protein [Faecalibacterium sp. An192]|uniref:hypothetical protein n=1 Tax=Faecalibacterium sp. An192 TaxID=1965581 RepID=UPI000B37430A|nr:hypothetical protein [Faecalibacterium sp. An192]OUP26937.1 hypothetical protein B5F27_11905 [Faecalibacterium sp. An192]